MSPLSYIAGTFLAAEHAKCPVAVLPVNCLGSPTPHPSCPTRQQTHAGISRSLALVGGSFVDLAPVVSRSITHLLVWSFTPSFVSCIQSVIHSSIHSFTHPCIYSWIDECLMATLCADCVLLLLLQTQRLGSVISVCSMWAPDSPEGSGRVCTAHPRGIESCPQLWGAAQGPDSRPRFGMPLLPHFTQARPS